MTEFGLQLAARAGADGPPGAPGAVGAETELTVSPATGAVGVDMLSKKSALFELHATGNVSLTISNQPVGSWAMIDFQQDATGGRTLTIVGPGAITMADTTANANAILMVYKSLGGVVEVWESGVTATASTAGTLVGFCSLTITTPQALSSSGSGVVWDTEISDVQGMHAASGTTVTVPAAAGATAMAVISCVLAIDITASTRIVSLRKNGAAIRPRLQSFETDGSVARKFFTFQVACAASDTFDIFYSGTNANSVGGEDDSVLSVSVYKLP